MQTVKIGDVEYPWPEDSKHFEYDEGHGTKLFLFRLSSDEDGPVEFCRSFLIDADVTPGVLRVCASVAVMHFENELRKLHEDKHYATYEAREAKAVQLRNAAAQWRTLCKEI